MQLQRLPLGDLLEVPPDELGTAVAAASSPFMLVLKPDDGERLAALRTRFPEGRLTPYADSAGRVMFTVFAAAPE